MYVITIILGALVIVLGYACYNIYRKYSVLETRENQYVQFATDLYGIITHSKRTLDTIDVKGNFEADDEVGFVFKEIKRIQDILYDFIMVMYENDVIHEFTAEKNEKKVDEI